MKTKAQNARPDKAQAGFSLLYVILFIVAISTLATSLATLTRTGMETQLTETSIAQARYMALAGFNYLKQFKEDYIELDGKTFSFGNAGEFTISEVRDNPQKDTLMEAKIVGRVNVGTPREANYLIFRLFNTESPGAITFRDDFEDFKVQTSDPSKQPVVKNADKTFTIGNNNYYAFGSMLYHGDKSLNWGKNKCNFEVGGDVPDIDDEGNTVPWGCELKEGFRMFFVSTYYTNSADGIVFTFFGTNSTAGAELNPFYPGDPDNDNEPTKVVCSAAECGSDIKVYTSIGGESQHGEMIGYAADGRVYDSSNGSNSKSANNDVKFWLDPEQNGIQPPKVGVEFDNYKNAGTGDICADGTFYPAVTSQRRDPSNGVDHIAYVFWGDTSNTPSDCALYHYSPNILYEDYAGNTSSAAGAATYDDNRHDAGMNTPRDDVWQSPFSWANNPFAFRLEVERNVSTGEYTLNAWVRQCSDKDTTDGPCREYFDRPYQSANNTPEEKLFFSDTSRFLCGGGGEATNSCNTTNTPDLSKTFTLASDLHEQLKYFIFGFTEATGGATQKATYSEFILQFIKENDYNASGEKRRVINKTIQ